MIPPFQLQLDRLVATQVVDARLARHDAADAAELDPAVGQRRIERAAVLLRYGKAELVVIATGQRQLPRLLLAHRILQHRRER